MLRYHMAVLTRDNRLKREVKRVTAATGSTADFIADASGLDPERPPNLAIYDARKGEPDKLFLDKVPKGAHIAYILDGENLVDKISLFRDERVDSLLCHDARFDDGEFIASATKALRGDVFGLQKYFPWGVTTFSMQVNNHDEKGRAIDILLRYAKLAGVRGPVRDRIQLVADELMMNALYHAPVDDHGNELYGDKSPKELAQLDNIAPIQVQYGCSGKYFGISVRDGGGSLTRRRALDYLMRARAGGAHIENKATGAGLGLVSVLRSVSKLVFNLDPGNSTEVVGLFDVDLFAQGKVGARSLHIFTQAPGEPEAAVDDEEDDDTDLRPRASAGKWALVAVLFAVVAAMGTAAYFKNVGQASAGPETAASVKPAPPSLVVHADPPEASITLDGKPLQGGVKTDLDGTKPRRIDIQLRGYEPFSKTLDPTTSGPHVELHVALQQTRRRGGR